MKRVRLFGKAPLVLIPPLVVLCLAPAILAEYSVPYPEKFLFASFVGSETCGDCHDEVAAEVHVGLHGSVLDEGAMGCESCHGPGSLHVESGEPADILNYEKMDASLSSSLCIQCHGLGDASLFEHSAHGVNDVSCANCHAIHGEQRTGLLAKSEPKLCYKCHQDIEAKGYLPSHHPVREQKMTCSDCHDVHGGPYKNTLVGDRPNDLCLGCHARYQGPFIFEHDPVIEDCGICHDPHGAVANNLLKQNEPFLCLQCHQIHFHAQIEAIDGEISTSAGPGSKDGYTGSSTPDAMKAAFLTNCTRCHSEIHGSDFPSQGISGQGRALTR